MGATLIVDDLELAPVLSGTHLPSSKGWKAELAKQREVVGESVDMTSTGNRTRIARMIAQWFTHYATAAHAKFLHLYSAKVRLSYLDSCCFSFVK